jgi:lipopolysaccharide/colanic/teichoic acid biosynthesis glycosyltransferase
MRKEPFWSGGGIWTRSVDRGAALTALIIIMPAIVMMALLTLITIGRPIFSGHRCIGINGAVYTRWRFRTAKSAHCIPQLGMMLRESRLDDLPHLFNIVCGYASFVKKNGVWSFFS